MVGRSSVWPSAHDLRGAALAIIRLVEFYSLDFDGLANGTMQTLRVAPLAISDFVYIAQAALDDGRGYLASVWISKTLALLTKMAPEDPDTKMRLQRKLAALHYKVMRARTHFKGTNNRFIFMSSNVRVKTKTRQPNWTSLVK